MSVSAEKPSFQETVAEHVLRPELDAESLERVFSDYARIVAQRNIVEQRGGAREGRFWNARDPQNIAQMLDAVRTPRHLKAFRERLASELQPWRMIFSAPISSIGSRNS